MIKTELIFFKILFWASLQHKTSFLSEGLFIWARLTGLARFPRSRLTSKSFVKFAMCSYERAGWLGSRDLGFSNRDLGKRAGNFCHMNTSSRLPGWMAGWILAVRMASSCIACCVFHIISIPFNCSDTALRVTDAKIGPKVKIFVFRYVCFVSQIWRQNSYPGSLTFSHLGNRAKISHMNPR